MVPAPLAAPQSAFPPRADDFRRVQFLPLHPRWFGRRDARLYLQKQRPLIEDVPASVEATPPVPNDTDVANIIGNADIDRTLN
jgi:hypothetical protein